MELIQQIWGWADKVLMAVGGMVFLASVLVRIFPNAHKANELVGETKSLWLKVIQFLPTFGLNPQTKEIEKALEELGKK